MTSKLTKLPKGWVIETIESLCAFNPKHQREISDSFEISFVPMATVNDVTGTIQNHESRPLGEVRKGYTHFAENDVIFAKITPCMENGKSAVARNLVNGLACGSTEFHVLRSYGGILPDYLHNFIRQRSYLEKAAGAMTGVVGQRRLPKEYLLQTQIPLPPLNEQRRIVEAIESLRAKVQRSRQALEEVSQLCDRFRQSVLAAAFRGDLTADWREQNSDVESALVLLKRIQEEIVQKRKKSVDELPDGVSLPIGWKWASLSDICRTITDGDHQVIPKVPEGIPLLDITNIRTGTLDFTNTRFVSESYYQAIPEYKRPERGAILYSAVGSYGIPALVETDVPFYFQRNMALLKPSKLVSSSYLLYALRSRFTFEQATKLATGTSQPLLSLTALSRIKVPITAPSEQSEIVSRLRIYLKMIEKLQQQYQKAKAYLDQLDRAILAKAFRGELVEQDPNDEPASVLLDRIRAERKAAEPSKTSGRKRSGQAAGQKGRSRKSNQIELPLE